MTSKAQKLSLNGHETNGELARRNLAVNLSHLQDMRGMMTHALELDDPALLAFDEGISKLAASLEALTRRNA